MELMDRTRDDEAEKKKAFLGRAVCFEGSKFLGEDLRQGNINIKHETARQTGCNLSDEQGFQGCLQACYPGAQRAHSLRTPA